MLVAGRRWGKTVLAVEEMLGFLVRNGDGWNVAYLAPTYGQARDICWVARQFPALSKAVVKQLVSERAQYAGSNTGYQDYFMRNPYGTG